MLRRLAVAVLALSPSQRLFAQLRTEPVAVVQAPNDAVIASAVCDGSEMTSAEQRRTVGNVLIGAGAAMLVLGATVVPHRTPGPLLTAVGAGMAVSLTGGYLRWSAVPNDDFWRQVIARAKTGATRSADIRSCLHDPEALSSAGTQEQWTYFLRRPLIEGTGKTVRTVTFSFQDSVLTQVRRTEVRTRPEDQTAPVIPVGVPLGTP
jgi:hypothetical protein